MSPTVLHGASIFAGAISAQLLLFFVFFAAIFLLCAWALVDCALRPPRAFPAAGKRTKGFWLAITIAATVVGFLAVPLGVVPSSSLFQFLAVIAAVGGAVYLVDVRPAVAPYSRRGGRGGRRSSSGW